MDSLNERTIFVTGAGSGIGAALATGLAEHGARVGVTDINLQSAQQVVEIIRQAGGQAHPAQIDVTDRASVAHAIAEVVEAFGPLHTIVNNAGVSGEVPFLEATEADWNRTMTVNGLGVLICMQEAAKVFIAQGAGGRIINTTSITAKNASPNFAPYAASKSAVSSLIQSGARALAPHNIRVTGFAPGIVDTQLWEGIQQDDASRQLKMQNYAKQILVGRVAVPQDLVPTVLFLASSGADYLTGQVITVDGGMVLS